MKLRVDIGTKPDVAVENQRLEEIDDNVTERVNDVMVSVICVSVTRTHSEQLCAFYLANY
jgi:hypothetical protein